VTHHALGAGEYALFCQLIEKRLGIRLGPDKHYFLEAKLKPLLAEYQCATYFDLYHRLGQDHGHDRRDMLAEAVITNETSWFRDGGPFRALAEELFPALMRGPETANRRIRIWSAACATGQEPYSIAITYFETLRSGGGARPLMLEILATDVSAVCLAAAKRGVYGHHAMERGMPSDIKARYFSHCAREYEITGEVKNLVTFERRNLKDDFSRIGAFDVIFMRNVTIYFAAGFREELLERVAKALKPGGCLFLGSSESLPERCGAFSLQKAGGALFYRRGQDG